MAPFQFGFEMGTGLRTLLPTAAPHLIAAAVLLTPGMTLLAALATGLGFGFGRTGTMWLGYILSGVTRSVWLRPWLDVVVRWCGFLVAVAAVATMWWLLGDA